MGSNQSSLPHFGTTSDIAAFSLMKKKFKEDIIADEKLLESAMKDISQKEDTLLKLTEKLEVSARSIEEKECALKSLEEKVALLKSRIDDAKAEITFFNEESSDLSCQVNVLKKAIIAKGNLATELRGAINLKQKHLLDISKKPRQCLRMSITRERDPVTTRNFDANCGKFVVSAASDSQWVGLYSL
ncbi:hypothetical protein BC829DRAFT_84264 [Chytridium lagenaria]|nr:hypothetical protein BC829DRAFT_84264 [Chytridium lagenaria]